MRFTTKGSDVSPYDKVGRKIKNAFGRREIVTMDRVNWDYLFWLDSINMDIVDFVKRCDLERGDAPLGEALSCWLRLEYEYREEHGLIQPWWLKEHQVSILPDAD